MDNNIRVDDYSIGKRYRFEDGYIMIPKHEYYETTFQSHKHVFYWNDINLKKRNVISLVVFDKFLILSTRWHRFYNSFHNIWVDCPYVYRKMLINLVISYKNVINFYFLRSSMQQLVML